MSYQVAKMIARIAENLPEMSEEIMQGWIENPRGLQKFLTGLCSPLEAPSNTIVRRVKVNRGQMPQQVIDATGRVKRVNADVLATMLRGEGEDKEVFFFKLDHWISDDDLKRAYEVRGLIPDPYAQAQANTDDPSLADEYPNGCYWQDANDQRNYATFHRWCGGRSVDVDRVESGWDGGWWFGGVRK